VKEEEEKKKEGNESEGQEEEGREEIVAMGDRTPALNRAVPRF
jgi:hypothetical protein